MHFKHVTHVAMLLLAAILLSGCGNAQVAHPLTETLAGNDPDSRMAFWHTLAQRKVTSNDEAFHGLLLLIDDDDPAVDYAGRVELLKSRGLLPHRFDHPADQAVRRGTLAVAICKAMNIEGGVVMRLFGASYRYASRELQYMNIYPEGSPHQTFRGDEFLYVIGRVEDYNRQVHTQAPAETLPGQEVQP